MPPGAKVVIKLFGRLDITVGERHLGPRDLGGIRPKQVLEILVAAGGHPVSTDQLAELLWGPDLPENAPASLQTLVSVLRRHLTSDREWARALVVTEAEAYRVETELVDLDLARFDALLTRANGEPPRDSRRSLEQALDLARGDVLEDEPYAAWTQALRHTYRARVLCARLDLAETTLAECDYAAALRHAEQAVRMDRFSERAGRLAMLTFYALGRQHEALDAYNRLRGVLAEELGLEPLPKTRALHSSILRQEDVSTLLPRPARPEAEPRLAGGPVVLLGRVDERTTLERVTRRALDGSFLLALIEGEAGVGKSRLLDELAASLDGVRIRRSTCSQLERHLPYVPLAAAIRDALQDIVLNPAATALPALREILPELRLNDEQRGFAEVDALEALVHRVEVNAPLVLLLDDLQWSDASTLGALAYIQRRCAALPVAVVGAVRSEAVGVGDPVRRLAPNVVVRLEPLTPSELAPLGLPDLYERTGGNARFVTAAVRRGTVGEPEQTMAETLIARCRAEGALAYKLLIWASVVGEAFEPEEFSRLGLGEPLRLTEELERLSERKILSVDGFSFRFRYSVVRQVLLHSVSPARRRVMRERLISARRKESQPVQAEPDAVPAAR